MRTRLTLDADLADFLKQRARDLGIPFNDVIDATIRAGLAEKANAHRGEIPRTIPHSFGFRPGIDLDKLGRLADEHESEAQAASAKRAGSSSRRQRIRSRAKHG